MRRLLREAIDAGAIGFSTSRQPAHQGAYGRPVPSRFAEVDEVEALAAVLGEAGRGRAPGLDRAGPVRRPVLRAVGAPRHPRHLDRARRPGRQARRRPAHRRAGRRPAGRGLPADRLPSDRHADQHERPGAAGRDRRVEGGPRRRPVRAGRHVRGRRLARPGPRRDRRGLEPPVGEDQRRGDGAATPRRVGVPLDRLAAERGTTPFDLLLDLALADDMATRFRIVLDNDGDDEIGDLLADTRTLLGLSDAGAHASQLCDACYSTHLLGPLGARAQGAVAGGRGVAPHRPPARRVPHPRAGPGAGGLPRRPGRLRPGDGRDARRSSGSPTSPAGPTGSWCAAPASSTSGSTASPPAPPARTSRPPPPAASSAG